MKTTKVLLGHCPVDSGQLVVCDPCYLREWKDGESDDRDSSYGKACALTLSERGGGTFTVSGPGGDAVAFASGWGDGCYPVWGYKDADGRITKVVIDMK